MNDLPAPSAGARERADPSSDSSAAPSPAQAPTRPSSLPTSAAPPPPDLASEAIAANQLTPEEQMARFEKELKETDWGHQPC